MKDETCVCGAPRWAHAKSDDPPACELYVPRDPPYAPPRLRSLGNVRKLTLAGTGHGPDFMAGRHQRRR